ncbi:hypothetical protein Arub01_45260 [Actinomadura rubrobrunea]|uniref:SecDF P1 head subdomain domain-containing protein n=1 Tax=Actinomadura rubrobrunea TaxID=115335 RepID=A0A9W6Q0Z9_9ACTN|nr:hypothetical protein [Actinomadura rubrobrunea]GLW66282.1 hypothetical protein Arub01_45260 [Actinomadura rubrobrunea]
MFAVVVAVGLAAFLLLRDQKDADSGGPTTLKRPVRFLAVEAVEAAPCGIGLLPDPDSGECLKVGSGMTVGRVDDIRVQPPDPVSGRNGYSVRITLTRQDAQAFAALTAAAARAQPPANRIAIVAEGQVLYSPQVSSPIPGGEVEISGPPEKFTKEHTEAMLRRITGR